MANYYKIPENDPDLEAFERLIADFHPWFKRFKKKAEGRPSYKHMNFSYRAFEKGLLPGNDDDYCPFAFTFFNEFHLETYLLDCHRLLETPYGRKRDKGINRLQCSFEQMLQSEDSKLKPILTLLAEKSLAQWYYVVKEYELNKGTAYIDSNLRNHIVEQCQQIGDSLKELSKSEELNVGELKTLDADGKYGVLAKLLLQRYSKLRDNQINTQVTFWGKKVNDGKRLKAETEGLGLKKVPFKGREYPLFIDVVLAHHLVKQLSHRPDMPSSPTDFIYKEISSNKFAKSSDLRTQYRWLFIKAWLYSYLNKYDLTLSEVARQISNDDYFFYMSEMPKLADFEKESHKEEIIEARFLDLKNNLSAWANDKSEDGYIYSQILENSHDQA